MSRLGRRHRDVGCPPIRQIVYIRTQSRKDRDETKNRKGLHPSYSGTSAREIRHATKASASPASDWADDDEHNRISQGKVGGPLATHPPSGSHTVKNPLTRPWNLGASRVTADAGDSIFRGTNSTYAAVAFSDVRRTNGCPGLLER